MTEERLDEAVLAQRCAATNVLARKLQVDVEHVNQYRIALTGLGYTAGEAESIVYRQLSVLEPPTSCQKII